MQVSQFTSSGCLSLALGCYVAYVNYQVYELSVDVSDDVDWSLELEQHRLLQEDLPGHHAQLLDLVLWDVML